MDLDSFFFGQMVIQLLQHHLLKRMFFLFELQCHLCQKSVALSYKLTNLVSQMLLFSSRKLNIIKKNHLAMCVWIYFWILFCSVELYVYCTNAVLLSEPVCWFHRKSSWDFDWYCIDHVDIFWEDYHLNNADSSHPCTW